MYCDGRDGKELVSLKYLLGSMSDLYFDNFVMLDNRNVTYTVM